MTAETVWGPLCRGKLPASLQAVEAEAVLLNKVIQHLITREGVFVVAWSPVQVSWPWCSEGPVKNGQPDDVLQDGLTQSTWAWMHEMG